MNSFIAKYIRMNYEERYPDMSRAVRNCLSILNNVEQLNSDDLAYILALHELERNESKAPVEQPTLPLKGLGL